MYKPDIELAIKNQKAEDLAPLIYGLHFLESSSGKADTTKPNSAGALGPLQVTPIAIKELTRLKLLPKDYIRGDPQKDLESGIAYIQYLASPSGVDSKDPEILGPAFRGGPTGAFDKDGYVKDKYEKYGTALKKLVDNYVLPPPPPPPPLPAPVSNVPAPPPAQMIEPDPATRMNTPFFNKGGIVLPNNYREGGRAKLI
jgi:hypothetical protein